MDRADVEHWIDRYRHAWSTDDAEDIAALFTEDATYSPFPWPRDKNFWMGRDAIIERWIGHGDSKAGALVKLRGNSFRWVWWRYPFSCRSTSQRRSVPGVAVVTKAVMSEQ